MTVCSIMTRMTIFIPYNFVDGIPSSIFTLCPPVCDAEGNLWFGNSKGLVSLDVAHMNQKKHDFYPVKVTDVHINGKPSTYPMVTVGSGDFENRVGAFGEKCHFLFFRLFLYFSCFYVL